MFENSNHAAVAAVHPPMTRERLHALAVILCSEDIPIEPGPLGRAALDEFRDFEPSDDYDEVDYRALCWFDDHVEP
jgi:hypothetical protein